MSSTLQTVFDDAMTLTPRDRAALAAQLLNSLDPVEEEGVEDAWALEIERRVHDLDAGTMQPVPHAEALRRPRTTSQQEG